jgi:hypothetical protein
MTSTHRLSTSISISQFRWSSRLILSAGLGVIITACVGVYEPVPLPLPDAIGEVQSKKADAVAVSVGILTDQQAETHFGIDLGNADIQAIWLRITNKSDKKLWFLRNALDPDFFSADEVAAVTHATIPGKDFESARQRLRDESIRVAIEPGTVTQGFIYAPKAIGGRYVDVRLGEDIYAVELARIAAEESGTELPQADVTELRFGFAVPLPDGIFDYERMHPEKIYSDPRPDLNTDEFRAALEALPCCASNAEGDVFGDPLNLVLIADTGDALNSLSQAGWSFTHRITPESIARLVGATIQNNAYPVAPVSNLYLFGRKQDFALQRARPNIAQRNHMRAWLAPFTFQNKNVWVGQISRDIGIKITPKSPSLTTHIIDPEVDLTREYLLDSLIAEGLIERFGFVDGSTFASLDQPAKNLTGDPYFSDGLRLVILISSSPISYEEIRSFVWKESAAPVAEGQSDAASGNVRNVSRP